MYQTPRMMVPVRTWQHKQQLVEYQRSHGDIIIIILCAVGTEEERFPLCPGKVCSASVLR